MNRQDYIQNFYQLCRKRGNMKKNEINIENLLSATRYTTKQEIMEKTGLSERKVRDLVSKLKKKRVVIYSSQTKGWRLAK